MNKIPILSYLALPTGAVLPWFLLLSSTFLIMRKPAYVHSPALFHTLMFALAGGVLAFVISIVATLFISSVTTSATRFGWGVGTSVAFLLLAGLIVFQQQRAAHRRRVEREEQRVALLAKKDPGAPAGSVESYFGEMLMVRPLDNHWWVRSANTNPDGNPASTMSVFNVRIHEFWHSEGKLRGIFGRIDDPGNSDTDEMWVTIIKQSAKDINLTKTQRFHVWIDTQKPSGYERDGSPIHTSGKPKISFWGMADVIADSAYNGYDPKDVEL